MSHLPTEIRPHRISAPSQARVTGRAVRLGARTVWVALAFCRVREKKEEETEKQGKKAIASIGWRVVYFDYVSRRF